MTFDIPTAAMLEKKGLLFDARVASFPD